MVGGNNEGQWGRGRQEGHDWVRKARKRWRENVYAREMEEQRNTSRKV